MAKESELILILKTQTPITLLLIRIGNLIKVYLIMHPWIEMGTISPVPDCNIDMDIFNNWETPHIGSLNLKSYSNGKFSLCTIMYHSLTHIEAMKTRWIMGDESKLIQT